MARRRGALRKLTAGGVRDLGTRFQDSSPARTLAAAAAELAPGLTVSRNPRRSASVICGLREQGLQTRRNFVHSVSETDRPCSPRSCFLRPIRTQRSPRVAPMQGSHLPWTIRTAPRPVCPVWRRKALTRIEPVLAGASHDLADRSSGTSPTTRRGARRTRWHSYRAPPARKAPAAGLGLNGGRV